MLSNPTNLQNRQRLHRRQNSTPNAFDSVKIQDLPNVRRHGAHRRGISLDTRQRQNPSQDFNSVSNTNQGYQTTQQHILRETQQHRLARPGHQYTTYDNNETFLSSPLVTPQRQSFDTANSRSYGEQAQGSPYAYSGPSDTINQVEVNLFNGANDFNLFTSESAMTPSAFMDFQGAFDNMNGFPTTSESRRSSGRRISGGIVDRVAQFEHLALNSPRPITPPNQNVTGYFPLTPGQTPSQHDIKRELVDQRFFENYDTSMEETIKPRPNRRVRDVFLDMRKESEMAMPSPPHSAQMPSSSTFDSAPMPTGNFTDMTNLNLDFMKREHFDGSHYSPASSSLSYHSSPEPTHVAPYGNQFSSKPTLDSQIVYSNPSPMGMQGSGSPNSYRRSESVSSMNIEETITDTGITIDDIATYIAGPDVTDGKWDCMFPECKKRFGRKENIKSHVQTHLGDRQFQCPHCKKCFVRQHDLKRHAKIHSGVKPYPCQCGNSFARHDALTRHRQRGMCIGAFDGVVKKTVKRGRPRKNRPDTEERISKSSRTRKKNQTTSSGSSSGRSDSTSGQSPRSDLDDILDDKPFGDYEFCQASTVLAHGTYQYSESQAQSPSHVDGQCVSPQMTQRSPSAFSTHSTYNHHRGSVSSDHQSHPGSPAKSVHSQYHSPPELCESSSSPAPSNHYYDVDTSSQHGDFKSMGLTNIAEDDDEMFLDAFAAAASNESMTQLERDPDMLMQKFGDVFTSTEDDLFHAENAFFGSP